MKLLQPDKPYQTLELFSDQFQTDEYDEALSGLPIMPDKKPWLIIKLSRPVLEDLQGHYPGLRHWGFVDDDEVQFHLQYLTVTSHRKMLKVLRMLHENKSYDCEVNREARAVMMGLIDSLRHEMKSRKIPPPPKSKVALHYEKLPEPIQHQHYTPKLTRKIVKYRHRVKSHIEIYKSEKTRRRIIEIEAFNGFCYRLLLNDRTPKLRSVHNCKGRRKGLLSRFIDNFQSLHDYYALHEKMPDKATLIKAGLGRILAAAFCEEENDLNCGNIVFDADNMKCYKIDHDQSTWPITSKYDNERPVDRSRLIQPVDIFPITDRDLTNFPHLWDATPKNFPSLNEKALFDLDGIENDEDFLMDVAITFLKSALLNSSVYSAMAAQSIRNESLRAQLITHKTARSQCLRDALIQNTKFRTFILAHCQIKATLLSELADYNGFYKEGSPLRLDLKIVEADFDALVAICKTVQTMNTANPPFYTGQDGFTLFSAASLSKPSAEAAGCSYTSV